MRDIIAITQVTLDGVMQAPGGPEEDPSNGFNHGGWAMPFLDDALNHVIRETIAGEFDMLLGRRTYEIFTGYWPKQSGPIAMAFKKATNTSSRATSTISTGRNRSVLTATSLRRSAS
jgi:dihydrofolate reductase